MSRSRAAGSSSEAGASARSARRPGDPRGGDVQRGLASAGRRSRRARAARGLRPPRLGPVGRARRLPAHDDRASRPRMPRRRSRRSAAGRSTVCGAGIGAVVALELAVRRAGAGRGRRPDRAAAPRPGPRGDAGDLRRRRGDPPRPSSPPAERPATRPTRARPRPRARRRRSSSTSAAASARWPPAPSGSRRSSRGPPTRARSPSSPRSPRSPAGPLPLAELPSLGPPAAVVVAGSTPPFLRRAAEALSSRLPGADLRELAGLRPASARLARTSSRRSCSSSA